VIGTFATDVVLHPCPKLPANVNIVAINPILAFILLVKLANALWRKPENPVALILP
jgi:hypothetical protein